MTVEELDELHHQLKNIAQNLADLLLPEWSRALDITKELHRLHEAANKYSLNRR
jgi:hypothetical protein